MGGVPPGGVHPCHMCSPPPGAYMGQGGMGEGGMVCPQHHNYYSDIEHYRPRVGVGGVVVGGMGGGPTSLHGYRMPPLDGGGVGVMGADPRLMLSDSETHGHAHHLHMYPGTAPGVGDGPHMDRACQSSLPSLANECIHSPGYRGSRNADSPMSEELPDYAGESDIDAARTTDCPTPESSVNGEAGDGSISGSMPGDWSGGSGRGTGSDSTGMDTASSEQTSGEDDNNDDNDDDHDGDDSSDSSFPTDTDFASTVARAAELSGLTVVGTTVTDPSKGNGGKKYRKHRSTAGRPTSPYSTDSNFSAVVHKPYPKSQRKKQLQEQARRHGGHVSIGQTELDIESYGQYSPQCPVSTPVASTYSTGHQCACMISPCTPWPRSEET
ncbi:hypothetical protein ACOMHN_066660 [Nucella lapillus]